MADISDEQKQRLLLVTRPAARTTFEDILYLRELVGSRSTSATALRHSSVVLRRLILQGELSRVAAPRLGHQFLIQAKQLKPVYKYDARLPLKVFASMGCNAFGVEFDGICAEVRNSRGIPDYHPDNRSALNIDSFAKQKVMALDGRWVTRRDVIHYVANKAGGAHPASGANEATERMLLLLREVISISIEDDMVSLNIRNRVSLSEEIQFSFTPGRIDAVLLELLAASAQLVNSPDCQFLQNVIEVELTRDHRV